MRTELLDILEREAGLPPLGADTLVRVFFVRGCSPLPTEAEIAADLEALRQEGRVERVDSPKMGARWRIARGASA